MRIFADEWGKLVYLNSVLDTNTIIRTGLIPTPGGRKNIPAQIIMSEEVIRCYNRSLTAHEKVDAMDRLAGKWIKFIAPELRCIGSNDKIAWLNILFGGRFPQVPLWFNKFIGENINFDIIAVKNEREPDKNDKFGWKLNRWGYLPTFNGSESWKPMTNEEKRNLPFKEINEIPPEYFRSNILVIIEGASASGGTLVREITNQINIRKNYKLPPIKEIYILVIFGSTLSAQLTYQLCYENNIKLHFCFAGSAINVSPVGLLPGLPYTDLSHLEPGSITYRELFEYSQKICVDIDNNQVLNRCCCGDVGESLDHKEEYIESLIIENLMLRIPLHFEGLMKFWLDRQFLLRLRCRIEKIEEKSKNKLRNSIGERILEVISKHELTLPREIPIIM